MDRYLQMRYTMTIQHRAVWRGMEDAKAGLDLSSNPFRSDLFREGWSEGWNRFHALDLLNEERKVWRRNGYVPPIR